MKKLLLLAFASASLFSGVAMAAAAPASAALYIDSATESLYQVKTIRFSQPGTPIYSYCQVKKPSSSLACTGLPRLDTSYTLVGVSSSAVFTNSLCSDGTKLTLQPGDNYLKIKGNAKTNETTCSISQTP